MSVSTSNTKFGFIRQVSETEHLYLYPKRHIRRDMIRTFKGLLLSGKFLFWTRKKTLNQLYVFQNLITNIKIICLTCEMKPCLKHLMWVHQTSTEKFVNKTKTWKKEKKMYCVCNTFAIFKKYIAVCRCRSENGKDRKIIIYFQ